MEKSQDLDVISTVDIKNININNMQEHEQNDSIEPQNKLDILYKIFVKFSVFKITIVFFHFTF